MTYSPSKLDDKQIAELQEKLGFVFPTFLNGLTLSMGICSAMINSGEWMFWFPKKWLAPVPQIYPVKWEQAHEAWIESERNLMVNGDTEQ